MKCFQAVESVFLVVIGKQNDQYSPSTDGPTDGVHLNSDPEALIRAMERVNALFDRCAL